MSAKRTGGPIANPIREMLDSNYREGVIFECPDKKKAENTRYAAYMLARRNGYSYKTMRKGTRLTVYKEGTDPYEMHGVVKVQF